MANAFGHRGTRARDLDGRQTLCVIAVVCLLAGVSMATEARAAGTPIVVNTTSSASAADGWCSLPEAITNANADSASASDCVAGQGADTILFDLPAPAPWTIGLTSPLPAISDADGLTITGPGMDDLAIDGQDMFRGFVISSTGVASIERLTITHGRAIDPAGGAGGGVSNAGTASLVGVRISDCVSTASTPEGGAFGGGIYNVGNLTIRRSTIQDNTASGDWANGGGIYSGYGTFVLERSTVARNAAVGTGTGSSGTGGFADGGSILLFDATAVISNSTISGNTVWSADGGGRTAGVTNYGGTLDVVFSTISGNTSEQVPAISGLSTWGRSAYDSATTHLRGSIIEAPIPPGGGMFWGCYTDAPTNGSLWDLGYNIESPGSSCALWQGTSSTTDPVLGPLQDNGGLTETHAPSADSPAIDGVPVADCAQIVDQRGAGRPQGKDCDIGAVEVEGERPAIPAAWCSAGVVTPCIESAQRNGSAIGPDDPTWTVAAGSTRNAGSREISWIVERKAGNPYVLGPGSLSDTWVIEIDTGPTVPRVAHVQGAVESIVRTQTMDRTWLLTVTAKPVVVAGGCDQGVWPWVCPEVATEEWDGYLAGTITDQASWEDPVARRAMLGIDVSTNISATSVPPEVTFDPKTGAPRLLIRMADPHFRVDGTTVVLGFEHLRIPFSFLRDMYGIDDPTSLQPSGIQVKRTGASDGTGTLSITVNLDEQTVDVSVDDMTFSTRTLLVGAGTITPRPPTKVLATRIKNTVARISFEPSSPRGSEIVGYQIKCVGGGKSIAEGASSPILVKGLAADTTAVCRARAEAIAGYGAWTRPIGIPPLRSR